MTAPETTSTRPYMLRALLEWCTDNGLTPHIAVRVDQSTQVPMEFVRDGQIVLNISYDATSGLLIGNEYVEFQARFGGKPRDIMVPVTTGHGSIDLIIPGVHKANGLRILQQRWGIEDSEVVAFGDSGNDVEMLRQSGFSFAMANARPHIKAAARFEAPHNNDEGVLNVIEKVLNGEAPFN